MRYHYYTNGKDLVIAKSTYAGKPVKGIAKCSPDDNFDFEAGKKLARARLDYKIACKRINRATGKCIEANKKLEEAKTYVKKMENYLHDSIEEIELIKNTLEQLAEKF